MKLIASQFAPAVIDVYGEMMKESPQHFDPVARALREVV